MSNFDVGTMTLGIVGTIFGLIAWVAIRSLEQEKRREQGAQLELSELTKPGASREPVDAGKH